MTRGTSGTSRDDAPGRDGMTIQWRANPGPGVRRYGWYGGVAIFCLNTCIVFVILNLVAYLRLPTIRPVPTVSKAMLEKVYPQMSQEEIDRLVSESGRDFM